PAISDTQAMTRDPILRAFERLAERDPAAPLVVTPERQASRGDVAAPARRRPAPPAPRGSRGAGAPPARAAATCLTGMAPPLLEGALIGLVAPNGPGFLASLAALARTGAAALLLDGQTPAPEALRIARALGAAGLLRCRTGWPAGPEDWSFTATPAAEPYRLPGFGVVKLTSGST